MIRSLILSVFIALMSNVSHADGMPHEVTNLVAAVSSIPGISEVQIQKTYLPDIKVTDLSLPGTFADLPIASLRRSHGSLPNELLVSINFRIQRGEAGLKALEFLSWWVRDESRGGENMQIRSIGLPPIAGNAKQLGGTLRFTIDWFYVNQTQDIAKLLSAIAEKTKSLDQAIGIYKSAF